MPAFALVPATPDDLPHIAAIQFAAFPTDDAFRAIFPKGGSTTSLTHFTRTFEHDMENDPTCFTMLVRDGLTKDIAGYAIWHFFPPRDPEEIEKEMLVEEFPLPSDANLEVGRRLTHLGIRKRHEIMAERFGMGKPYAYLAAIATSPKYQRLGVGAMLVEWGVDRADDMKLPAYVESTPEGLRLYQKYGFQQVEVLPLDLSPVSKEPCHHFCMVRSAENTG